MRLKQGLQVPRYDHSSSMKPIYFLWMSIAVVNYAKPNTRWRHRAHKQMVNLLNKIFLITRFSVYDLSLPESL